MRLHFQARPWDLYIVVGYTLAMSAFLISFAAGNFLAILLVLLAPGYVLMAALFPSNREIDWIERIALSVGLSVAAVTLLGLLLNFVWEIRFLPIVVAIAIFTGLWAIVAYVRRLRLPVEQRLSATLELPSASWREESSVDKLLAIALAASIVVAALTLAYVLLAPRPAERFTEFYILGPNGNATGYPTTLTRGQNGTVIVGVVNHEATTVDYTIRIDLVGVRIVYNATSGYNETVELNRTTRSSLDVSLGSGAIWTQRYTFSITNAGLWEVQFLLLQNGAPPRQELHLLIRVP